MEHLKIIKELSSGQPKPIYLLHGEEAYYIDLIVKAAEENVLDEAQKSFNYTQVYGRDADPESLGNALRRFPMMSPLQLIILKEAKDMRKLKDLEPYVKEPNATTVFVIAHKNGKINGNTHRSFISAIKKNGVVFESKGLRDYQMGKWISNYIQSKKYTIQSKVAALIAESLGTQLSKVSNELDKLFINLPEGSEITKTIVEDQIGISKDYNPFELNSALAQRDVLKANRIINYFIANPKAYPLVWVISTLYGFYSKVYMAHYCKGQGDSTMASTLRVNPYFVKEYRLACKNYPVRKCEYVLTALSAYDLKSKGFKNPMTDNGELMRELVWKILH